jgi:hypothetical protein
VVLQKKRWTVVSKIYSFSSTIRILRRWWQLGLLARIVIRLCGYWIVFVVIAGFADLLLAFDYNERLIIDGVIVIVSAALGFQWLLRIYNLNDFDIARKIDILTCNKRKTTLSGVELLVAMEKRDRQPSDLSNFLTLQAIESANQLLKNVKVSSIIPWRKLKSQGKTLICQFMLVWVICIINLPAAETIVRRFVHPGEDIPPFSNYSFQVTPSIPDIIYGSSVEVTVAIDGGRIEDTVFFVARSNNRSYSVPCFKMEEGCYGQRLEKVISPIEFCFRYGRARSKWHDINLIVQPRIALAKVTVSPPEYSLLSESSFFLGNRALAVLKGTELELTVTSNRPLLDGVLKINTGRDENLVTGTISNLKSVKFAWTVSENADLEVVIRDIRGTKNLDPLVFTQKLVKDNPPDVGITSPASFAMATSSSKVPLTAYAYDDYGLKDIILVMSVVGFRDRAINLDPGKNRRDFQFNHNLSLAELGAEAGQILEFFLEASDSNPALTGFSTSPIARLQVISDEEYRSMVRSKITMEKVLNLHSRAQAEVAAIHTILSKLESGLKNGASEENINSLKKELSDQLKSSDESFQKLRDFFMLSELDSELVPFLSNMSEVLKESQKKLQTAGSSKDEIAAIVKELKDKLAPSEQGIQESGRQAKTAAAIARVLSLADDYREIVEMQKELVRRLERFTGTGNVNLENLPHYGEMELRILRALKKFMKQLEERSNALGSEFAELKFSASEFIKNVELLEIPSYMGKCAIAANNLKAVKALELATLVLKHLKLLMSDCTGEGSEIANMLQGKITFKISQAIAKNLKQIMSTLKGMTAGKLGQTMAGDGKNSQTQNSSVLNTPMYGPLFVDGGESETGEGPGKGENGMDELTKTIESAETLPPIEKSQNHEREISYDQVPEKYRDAVKRYFSTEGGNQ